MILSKSMSMTPYFWLILVTTSFWSSVPSFKKFWPQYFPEWDFLILLDFVGFNLLTRGFCWNWCLIVLRLRNCIDDAHNWSLSTFEGWSSLERRFFLHKWGQCVLVYRIWIVLYCSYCCGRHESELGLWSFLILRHVSTLLWRHRQLK